jgi:hypothetical protein
VGWEHASRHASVLKLNPGYITDASDEDLAALSENVSRLGIAVGVEVQPVAMQPSDHCGNTEGYDDIKHASLVISKLQRARLIPKYIALDEPVWFGHYAEGPLPCRFTIPDVAGRVADIVTRYLEAFPNVTVGDIEPVPPLSMRPDWESTYRTFKQELEQRTHHVLAFVQVDVDWPNPGWPQHLMEFAKVVRQLGMGLGIIYNGDGSDPNEIEWLAHARHNFTLIESAYGIIPSQAVFQTWNRFPNHALPETSPSAHTWLIDQYIVPRTHFTWKQKGRQIDGRLVLDDGSGVPNASIETGIKGMDPKQPPPKRVLTGIVPERARYGIIGVRINRECLCAGPNNLMIGGLTYSESHGASATEAFDFPRVASASRTDGVELRNSEVQGTLVAHIVVRPGQSFGVNSPAFAVTPGATFTFTAPIGSLDGNGMFGSATVIWLDENKKGFQRANIQMAEDVRPGVTLRTDKAGRFVILRSMESPDRAVALRLHFEGTSVLRGASADVP